MNRRFFRFASTAVLFSAIAVMCHPACAQRGQGRRGMPGSPGQNMSLSGMYQMLLRSPTVQKDLDLVEEQKTQLDEASKKSRDSMRELFSGMRDLSPEERRAKMDEIRKKMDAQAEELNKAIRDILLPSQMKRLREISIQRAGVMALEDKEVQKELKLTDDQIAKMKSIEEDGMKKMRELMGSGDRSEMREKMGDIRKELEKQLMDVLTAEQKESFKEMKGETLDIPQDEMRGMMGRPRDNSRNRRNRENRENRESRGTRGGRGDRNNENPTR